MSNVWETTFDKHGDLIATCDTLDDFIAAIPERDAYKDHMRKYAGDYSRNWFLTFKLHGYSPKALEFPRVTSINEMLHDYDNIRSDTGNGMFQDEAVRAKGDRIFVSSSRMKSDAAPFGYIGKYYIKVRDDEFFCFGHYAGHSYATYAKPSRLITDAFGVEPGDYHHAALKIGSFEFVERGDGTTLVTARSEYSSYWLAILNTDQLAADMRENISVEFKARWDAQKAQEARAASCVDGKTVDFDKAKRLGVEIRC